MDALFLIAMGLAGAEPSKDATLTEDEKAYVRAVERDREENRASLQRGRSSGEHIRGNTRTSPSPRISQLDGLSAQYDRLKASLKDTATSAELKAKREKLAYLKKHIADIKSGKVIDDPVLRPIFEVGSVGVPPWPFKVMEVLGPQSFLATLGTLPAFMVNGVATQGLVEDQSLKIDQIVIIAETRAITVNGAQRTVFVLRPVVIDRTKVLAVLNVNDKPERTAVQAQPKAVNLTAKAPLGLQAKPFSDAKTALLPATVTSGIVVGSLDFDALLERNGLRLGDVLTQLGSAQIHEVQEIERWHAGARVGATAVLVYYRLEGNHYKRVSLRLKVDGAGEDWLGERAYDRYPEAYRDKLKAIWRRDVAETRAQCVKLKKQDTPAGRQKAREEFTRRGGDGFNENDPANIPVFQERLAQLRANNPPFLVQLVFPQSWHVGDLGMLAVNLRVIKVISPTEALVEPFSAAKIFSVAKINTPGFVFYIKDVETTAWADGGFAASPGLIEVYGTYPAGGVNGRVKAVRALH